MTQIDSFLVERLKNSDESAFKSIYNKYFPRLFYFVYEFIPQSDMAENIVQDTFMVLWAKRDDLKDQSNLAAYLFTVAKNNCLQLLRNQKIRKKLISSLELHELEIGLNIESLESMDTTPATFREIEHIIQSTFDELPPQCQKVFEMSRFGNLKNKEIAEQLHISVKVVEKHISKGLKKFRAALKDYYPFVAYLFL
ncbi:MAG: RNA polymerase sigma-70 factor [Breznakibacter sp.]